MDITDVATPTSDAKYDVSCRGSNCFLKAESLTVEELRLLADRHDASHRLRVVARWSVDSVAATLRV